MAIALEDDEAPTDTLAVISLVLSFAGLAIPFIASIAALICAGIAKKRIAASNGSLQGRWYASAAQLISVLALLGMILVAAMVWVMR